MLFGVARKNVATSGDDQVLCITKGVQIVDTNVSDEEGCGGSKGGNNSQDLTMIEIPTPPPSVDSGRPG
jgi:hypothetical protein